MVSWPQRSSVAASDCWLLIAVIFCLLTSEHCFAYILKISL